MAMQEADMERILGSKYRIAPKKKKRKYITGDSTIDNIELIKSLDSDKEQENPPSKGDEHGECRN